MAKLYNSKEELRALKSMCMGSEKLKSKLVSRLDPEHFYSVAAREAVVRLKSLLRTDGDIPTWNELCADPVISEAGRETLSKYKGEVYENEKEAVRGLRVLNKYYKMRTLYFMTERINEKLLKDKVDIDDIMDFASVELNKARVQPSENVPIFHLGKGSNSSALLKRILNDERPDLIPTGFKAFDSKNGGIMYGSLMLLGGNTGGGKSTMGIQLLRNMAEYCESVAYVPLEMTEEETFMRLGANLARVPLTKIVNKKLTKAEKKKIWDAFAAYDAKIKKNGNRYTVFSPEQDMTVEDIIMTLKPYGHRVILIDYISLLKGVDGDDAWQALGKVARFCKIYAKNNNVIIILLVQINDEGAIRYSKAVVEHANNAFFWVSTDETRENGIVEIKQKKARNQQMFDFQLRFEPEYMTFRDIDDETHDDMGDDDDVPDSDDTKSSKSKDKSEKKQKKEKDSYLDEDLEDIGSSTQEEEDDDE